MLTSDKEKQALVYPQSVHYEKVPFGATKSLERPFLMEISYLKNIENWPLGNKN